MTLKLLSNIRLVRAKLTKLIKQIGQTIDTLNQEIVKHGS